MAHVKEFRWRPGASPEGAYRVRLFEDHEGKRAAIVEAATDNEGPTPVNAASATLRDMVCELWIPPADRVLVTQAPVLVGGNRFDEIDGDGEPSIRVPGELVERWKPLAE